MSKRMLIDASHPEETRLVILSGNRVDEFDFESVSRKPLKGNIYLAKVIRVEPSLQAAFVEYGGNRHGFLAFAEIHPDYYQIPYADRQALLAAAEDDEGEDEPSPVEAPEPPSAASDTDPMPVFGEPAESTAPAEGFTAEPAESSAGEPEGDIQEIVTEPVQTEVVSEGEADDSMDEPEVRRPSQRFLRKYKIQEVIKKRQVLLIQAVKEERGNKGAALTTYLSLAGRYCVLMPNSGKGGGISRKITNAADRRRLKDSVAGLDVPEGMGLIVRTAGAARTKQEIQRDYEYLLRLWESIRDLTLRSIAPALVYEEGNLIKRAIRDHFSRDIEEIIVEGQEGFDEAQAFARMLMPGQADQVKLYDGAPPLYQRYKVEAQLDSMFNPRVQLRSGGYIIINQTEALVAVDVNSGRATKEHNIEDTALKTNLEAAEEIARQVRLRDLAGLIVIDFIDMEENRNDRAVERRLKECLRHDRARIQLGRISPFGLLEMSRQRLRPGMVEGSTVTCPHCNGTGLIRSVESLALRALREVEDAAARASQAGVALRLPVEVANYLLNHKRAEIAAIEDRVQRTLFIEGRPGLYGAAFEIEPVAGLPGRARRPQANAAVSAETALAQLPPMADEDEVIEEEEDEASSDEDALTPAGASEQRDEGRRGRRRRGRSRDRDRPAQGAPSDPMPVIATDEDDDDAGDDDAVSEAGGPAPAQAHRPEGRQDGERGEEGRRRRRGRRGGRPQGQRFDQPRQDAPQQPRPQQPHQPQPSRMAPVAIPADDGIDTTPVAATAKPVKKKLSSRLLALLGLGAKEETEAAAAAAPAAAVAPVAAPVAEATRPQPDTRPERGPRPEGQRDGQRDGQRRDGQRFDPNHRGSRNDRRPEHRQDNRPDNRGDRQDGRNDGRNDRRRDHQGGERQGGDRNRPRHEQGRDRFRDAPRGERPPRPPQDDRPQRQAQPRPVDDTALQVIAAPQAEPMSLHDSMPAAAPEPVLAPVPAQEPVAAPVAEVVERSEPVAIEPPAPAPQPAPVPEPAPEPQLVAEPFPEISGPPKAGWWKKRDGA